MFFWNSLAFSSAFSADVGILISASSAFSKSSLNIWKCLVHVLLKLGLENFEHYFASMWNECNCAAAWTFFDIALLWDWNENWCFLVLWPLLSFPYLLAYWVQHFNSIIFVPFIVSLYTFSMFNGEEMATHSSILAWRIPRMEQPSRLQTTGSQRSQLSMHTKDSSQ